MSRRAPSWVLLLIFSGTFLVYLAGNGAVGLFDRDEPRYAQTSRQMLQSGDWVVPHFLDKIRTAKPVFIYWCQAAAMKVFGDDGFAARFPSSLAMVLTLIVLAIAIQRECGAQRGRWTAFILGSSALAIASAKMCLTDSVLLLWITISQLCLYRLWRRGTSAPGAGRTIIVLGLSIGLAGLTKGPVALGINLTTLIALALLGRKRERISRLTWNDFPLVAGVTLAIVFAVVSPWLYLIQHRAPEFLGTAIGHDVVDRMQRGQEGHSYPPGFYSLIVWGTYFPWSLLLPAAVVWGWRRRNEPQIRFALAAWLGPWVMFELIATKLPHYVLPTFPALAFLTADMLVRAAARGGDALRNNHELRGGNELRGRGFRIATVGWAIFFAAAGFGPIVALIAARQHDVTSIAGGIIIAILAVTAAYVSADRLKADRVLAAARSMGGGMLLCVAAMWTLFLPYFQLVRISQNAAAAIIAHGGYGEPGLMIDYKEPSLAFAQGGGLREQPENDYLQTSDPAGWPRWVVLTGAIWDKLPEERQKKFEIISRVVGTAYSDGGGRREVIVLRRND